LGFIAKESSYLLYDTWGELRVMSAFWIDGAWRHSTSTGVNSNQWYHLVTTYSSLDRTIRFYIDGNEVAPVVLSGLSAYSLNISANNVHLGNGTLGKKNRVDEARIYNRVLTAEEVRYHYNHGGPVAYWDMDEGSGLKINDKSGNGNDGTISGATWTQGKHGSALSFDGSNDYAIVPHNDSLGIVADITIGAWIKKNNPDIRNDIVYKTTGGYSFMTHYTDRALYFQAQDSGGVWRAVSSNSNAIVDSDWHYVAVTYSRPDVVFYVDGKYWGTASRDYDMKSTSGSLYVGSMASTNYFNGQIDEVKIYDYARTEEEIRLDYNAGLATHLGPSGKTCSEDPAGCMDYGLAGHWDMDEGSGSMINDKSGNNNHGTLTNGPKWTKGKSGGALQFDGKDDYVSVADSDSLTFGNGVADSGFSIESWVRYDVIGAGHSLLIAQKNNEYALTNNNWLRLYLYDRSTGGILARDAIYLVNTYKKGEWIHLIVTYDGSALSSGIKFYLDGKLYNGGTPAGSSGTYVSMENTADNLEIAYPGTDAALDGVKIYNRALSAEEVRYHYNQGKPVGYWAFDEGEGTRAFDVSGNNNTGVLTNGPTWVEGKHGSALSFDGTDDSVSCPGGNLALTGDLTISAWIKLNSTSGYHWIVSKNYTKEYTFGTHNSELRFYHGDGSYYASDSLNAGLSSNNWYYVSVSRDTDQKKVKFYVNGKYISEWNYTNDITSSTQMVKIGTRSDDYSWFDGFIDEVKVYNYARTAEQIMQDYNAGVATHLK